MADDTCRACARVPVPGNPSDDTWLYCVLPPGHSGSHYDDGADVTWSKGRPDA